MKTWSQIIVCSLIQKINEMLETGITFLQGFINNEFNKILPLKLEENTYNIIIRKDHIPRIISLVEFDSFSIISFSHRPLEDLDFENNISFSLDGEIEAIKILKSKDFYSVFISQLNEIEQSYSETSREEKLFRHRQIRFLHAIKKIIQNMTNRV